MGRSAAVSRPSPEAVVEIFNASGEGDVVLACEHASAFIPDAFHHLGLGAAIRSSHIAWDPGALAVARHLSQRLDAPLVAQRVSRLVFDCNRAPDADSAIPWLSEIYPVPGNQGLSHEQRAARAEGYYWPFHDALRSCLDRRAGCGRASALVTIHSFTPVYLGVRRLVQLGIVHDDDARLADLLLNACGAFADGAVRRNEPYGPRDGVTHTLRVHACARGLPNAMIEIRNDLIADAAGVAAMADRLAAALAGVVGRTMDVPA